MKKVNIMSLFSKNKPLLIATSIVVLAVIAISVSVLVRPKTTKSEFDINGLNDQVQNHEERIGDLENKTDKTQTQTNQNSADIKNIQDNTNTSPAPTVPEVHTPVAQPTTTPTPPDPNNNSWVTSHGTFIFRDIGTVKPMYTSKDVNILFSFSNSNCSGFRANEVNLIPAGTKVVWNNQYFPN